MDDGLNTVKTPKEKAKEKAAAAKVKAAEKKAKEKAKADAAKAKAKEKAAAAKEKAKAAKVKAVDGEALVGPAILRQYATGYVHGGADGTAKSAGGSKAIDCGDKLAEKLRGKTLDEVYAMAAKTLVDDDEKPIAEKTLRAKYAHLNVGMQRMNVGNRMRAVLNAK